MSAGSREQLEVYLREHGVSFDLIEHGHAEAQARENPAPLTTAILPTDRREREHL